MFGFTEEQPDKDFSAVLDSDGTSCVSHSSDLRILHFPRVPPAYYQHVGVSREHTERIAQCYDENLFHPTTANTDQPMLPLTSFKMFVEGNHVRQLQDTFAQYKQEELIGLLTDVYAVMSATLSFRKRITQERVKSDLDPNRKHTADFFIPGERAIDGMQSLQAVFYRHMCPMPKKVPKEEHKLMFPQFDTSSDPSSSPVLEPSTPKHTLIEPFAPITPDLRVSTPTHANHDAFEDELSQSIILAQSTPKHANFYSNDLKQDVDESTLAQNTVSHASPIIPPDEDYMPLTTTPKPRRTRSNTRPSIIFNRVRNALDISDLDLFRNWDFMLDGLFSDTGEVPPCLRAHNIAKVQRIGRTGIAICFNKQISPNIVDIATNRVQSDHGQQILRTTLKFFSHTEIGLAAFDEHYTPSPRQQPRFPSNLRRNDGRFPVRRINFSQPQSRQREWNMTPVESKSIPRQVGRRYLSTTSPQGLQLQVLQQQMNALVQSQQQIQHQMLSLFRLLQS